MAERETINGTIRSTKLGLERGCLTFSVTVEGGSSAQGIGGYALTGSDRETKTDQGWGDGLLIIKKILETVGVQDWEDLKGTLVRIKFDGWGSLRPPVIGHILEDKWFDIEEHAKDLWPAQRWPGGGV